MCNFRSIIFLFWETVTSILNYDSSKLAKISFFISIYKRHHLSGTQNLAHVPFPTVVSSSTFFDDHSGKHL
ncbi:hypothetical protein HanIR_Chr10g0495121 [Helianthus annuus]|nr:hypothetical protein HanIR_Chr10g0495121 [Helianthus annuus]